MSERGFINIVEEIIGLTVIGAETGGNLGQVVDLTVNPVNGEVRGLLLTAGVDGDTAVKIGDVYLGKDEIRVLNGESSLLADTEYQSFLSGGVTVRGDLLNAKVVTKDGRLLGRIAEAYVTDLCFQLIYRVSEPGLSRLIGRGFYLPGRVPGFLSRVDRRLIVPAETPVRFACRSLNEAARLPIRNEAEVIGK